MNKFLDDFIYGFRRILKNLPDAVFIVEKDGRITWVNDKAANLFEIKKKTLKTYNFDDLIDNSQKQIEKSISTKSPIIAGAITPNSKEFFVELNAKLHHNRYIVTVRDITAITNVLTNAEQTNKFNEEKNSMLVKLANEIKSPINSIVGFSQALMEGIGGEINEKQNKYVNIINKSSNDFLHFMDKFIEFSYAESSLYEYDFQTFDIINAIQTIIKNNEELTAGKDLIINFDYEDVSTKAIYSDENTLKTIIENVLETSLQLTEAGTINIKLSYPDMDFIKSTKAFFNAKEGSLMQISITDTGIGLQETEIDNIFEPYEQLNKPHRKNFVRSLALGTASILTKRLNGIIGVESEVMKGTTFNIIIPIEKDSHE